MKARHALYLKVYQHLKDAITTGRFSPGDMIPTEHDLMEKFGVSRITTNRALQMLTNEGLIKRRAGVGTFVCMPAEPDVEPNVRTAVPSVATRLVENNLVGFVMPHLDGSFGPIIVRDVERILSERGMSLVIASSYGDQQCEQEVIDRLVRTGVKGLIVLPVNGEYYSEAILRLHVAKFPIVLVDKSLPGVPIPSVSSDNYAGAKWLTEHLLSLGHRTISFVSLSLRGTSTLVNRFNGYADALAAYGLSHNPDYHVTGSYVGPMEDGLNRGLIETIRSFLIQHPEVTALFAADNDLADHALAAALQAGRQVPEACAITCFDGPLERKLYWDFTRAVQNEQVMAQECVRILDELWAGERAEYPLSVVVPCHLRIGSSTVTIAQGIHLPHQLVTSRE